MEVAGNATLAETVLLRVLLDKLPQSLGSVIVVLSMLEESPAPLDDCTDTVTVTPS